MNDKQKITKKEKCQISSPSVSISLDAVGRVQEGSEVGFVEHTAVSCRGRGRHALRRLGRRDPVRGGRVQRVLDELVVRSETETRAQLGQLGVFGTHRLELLARIGQFARHLLHRFRQRLVRLRQLLVGARQRVHVRLVGSHHGQLSLEAVDLGRLLAHRYLIASKSDENMRYNK